MIGSLPCGCQNKCLPCLINRRRTWTGRLLLERRLHAESCFVTLTYDSEHVPRDGSLVPKDAQDWLKRLRRRVSPSKIRFFLAGEYGERTERPHFHVAIFGCSAARLGGPESVVRRGRVYFIDARSPLAQSWGMGFVSATDLTPASAEYIAGYVTKKLRGKEWLNGRYPEYSRMSLRPGIGAGATGALSRVLSSDGGVRYLAEQGDVPNSFRHGVRILPLGRYLRGRLRKELCVSQDGLTPPEVLRRFVQEELPRVRREYEALAEIQADGRSGQKIMLDERAQKSNNLAARVKIFNGKSL